MKAASATEPVTTAPWCTLAGASLAARLDAHAGRVTALVAAAVDGEPLVETGRAAAREEAAALLVGLRAAGAAVRAARLVVAVERRARDAAAALRAAGAGGGGAGAGAGVAGAGAGVEILVVEDVAGCRDQAWLMARAGGAGALVVDAVALVDHARALAGGGVADDGVLVSVGGAVAAAAVRRVPVGATVASVVDACGGALGGPAWVALRGGPIGGVACERDDVVDRRWRALVVLPGWAEPARRGRGDRRAGAEATPLGVERAWLGAGRGAEMIAAGAERPSLELVALRLGLPAEGLAWIPPEERA